MTQSTPVKIVALAALALVLGLGAILLLTSHRASSNNNVVTPPPTVRVVKYAAAVHKPVVVHIDPTVPLIVRAALEKHEAVVVAIYSSRVSGDRAMLAAARSGAHEAHVGFVAANVANEQVATGVATWSNGASDPEVIVVRRPGKVVFDTSGLTDDATIAQAATSAR